MTTKELHLILNNKSKTLSVTDIQNIICELQNDCVTEMANCNSTSNERYYAGENNAFYICLDLLEHLEEEKK